MIEAPHGDPQQQLQLQLSAMVPAAGQNCCTIQGINASTLSLSIEQYAVKISCESLLVHVYNSVIPLPIQSH
jgi:hypothetical protein